MDNILITDQEIGKFDQREDGVYLAIFRSNKEKYDFEAVRKEIIRKGVVNANFDVIYKIWEEAKGEPTKIADYFERYDPIKDKYIEVNISDNEMEAYLSLGVPEGIVEIIVNDVLYKLYQEGVEEGIDEKLIEKIVKSGQPVRNVVAAKGKPVKHGDDAKIDILIDLDKSSKPLITEDGSVDFKNINLIKVVDKDQLLAVKTPATEGEIGYTVTGRKMLPVAGEDHPMPRGKNTYLSEDSLQLFSEMIGNVFYEDSLLHVENVYVVRYNVDFSTGNISYPGDVVINGDVKADFSVHTEGNIIIRGTVEAAEIVSTGGNIDVKKGIIGTQQEKKAKIVADGNVKALFIQEAVVSAGKDIEVGSYILNSSIHAEHDVKALRDRGLIAGSNIFSGNCVRAKNIGSMSDTKTQIKVGKIIKDDISFKKRELDDEIGMFDQEEKLLHKRLDFIELLKKRLPHFPPEKEKELAELLEKIKKLEEVKKEVIGEKDDFNSKFIDQFGVERKIYVLQTLWPGVLVGINDVVRKVDARQRRVSVTLEDNQIELKRLTMKEATGGESDIEDEEEGDEE
ncbi:MAG TPA: FapA family protein [archaeon]|nr:FapA family protein [archaeon]